MAHFFESTVHALQRCFAAVQAVLKEEREGGDAMTSGLSTHTSSAEFKALLWFLSDVLSILGTLSVTFQTKDLNLPSIEKIVNIHLSALDKLKNNPFVGGYMKELESDHPSVVAELGRERFLSKCKQYLAALIDNINARFEKIHLVSLL